MTQVDERIQQLNSSARTYRFLSHVFLKEPTTAELNDWDAGEMGAHLRKMGYDLFDDLGSATREEQAETLAIEYCRLFVGPGPHLSPHEAVIRGEKRHWGEYTVAVGAAYRDAGFDLAPEVREMPDHIGVELSFCATLCEQEAEHLDAGNEQEARHAHKLRMKFLAEHPSAWLPDFAQEIADRAEVSFYKTMSKMAADWIQADASGEPA